MDCVFAIFWCLFLNFAKLRCAHFPSYLLFFKCTIFSVVFGLLVLFTKMGQIFVKLTIFYRDTINLLWLRRYSYNAVFSLKDASFHSICLFKTLLTFPFLKDFSFLRVFFYFLFVLCINRYAYI